MKSILLTIMILAQMSHARTFRGNDSGGGSSLSAEFVSIGRYALQILMFDRPNLGISNVESILNQVEVFDVNQICFTDHNSGEINCLDAYFNSDGQKIIFDRKRWSQKSCVDKFVIASHEYLRVAGLEDANYINSSLFLGHGISERSKMELVAICNEQGARNEK